MPKDGRYRYICTIQCSFTKFAFAYPCQRDRAVDAAECLSKLILQVRCKPTIVSSDRGSHFCGEVYKETLKNLGIMQQLHVSWRPQSSGGIERFHRTLKNALWMVAYDRQAGWSEVLPYVMSSLNALYNTAIKTSPFECVYGRNPCMNLPRIVDDDVKAKSPLSYNMKLSDKLSRIHQLVMVANVEADEKLERLRNQPHYKETISIGDHVLLFREQSAAAKEHKLPWLDEQWKVINENGLVYLIENSAGKKQWVHRLHLRLVYARKDWLKLDQDDDSQPAAVESPKVIKLEPAVINTDAENVVTPAVPANRPPEGPTVGVGQSPVKKKKGKSKPPPPDERRVSGRNRKPPDRLNIEDTNSKSYKPANSLGSG